MAQALARLAWQPSSRLALAAPWPDAQLTFAPAGFVTSAVRDAAASPVCAPGFSLLAAPACWPAGLAALVVPARRRIGLAGAASG